MSEASIKECLRSKSKTDMKDSNMAGSSGATSSTSTPISMEKGSDSSQIGLISIPKDDHDFSSQSIRKLLQELVTSINDLKVQTATTACIKDSISNVQSLQSSFGTRLNQVEEILDKAKTKLNLVGNLLIRQEERFKALQSKVRQMK